MVVLTRSHGARIHAATVYPLDTRLVPQLASQPTDSQRWWQLSTSAEYDDADRLLQATLSLDELNGATAFAGCVVPIAMSETSLMERFVQYATVSE